MYSLPIGTMAGGQGKTTTAVALVDMMRAAKRFREAPEAVQRRRRHGELSRLLDQVERVVVPIDVDVDASALQVGKEIGTSNLSRRFPDDAIPYALEPAMLDVMEDPRELARHFDPLFELQLKHTNTVVDLGANVVNRFCEWARISHVGRGWSEAGMAIDFIAVSTADRVALDKAAEALERVAEICREYDTTHRLFIVFNHRDRGFERYESAPEMKRIAKIGATAIHMPKCESELAESYDLSEFTPSDILLMTDDELAQTFKSLSKLQAWRGGDQYHAWYYNFLTQILQSGLLGNQVAVTAKVAKGKA